MKHAFVVVILVVGCGKSIDTDWSKKPLVATSLTLEGVTFSINVPEGLPRDDRNPGDWSNAKVEYDAVPKVFTALRDPDSYQTLDDLIRGEMLDPKKINLVRKETRPDGFALTDAPTDKHRVEAIALKRVGAKLVKCTAVQVVDGGELPSYDATKAMLEKICDSIAAK